MWNIINHLFIYTTTLMLSYIFEWYCWCKWVVNRKKWMMSQMKIMNKLLVRKIWHGVLLRKKNHVYDRSYDIRELSKAKERESSSWLSIDEDDEGGEEDYDLGNVILVKK